MRKIVVYLRGGLGNQMFQYSLGRALAKDINCELVLDDWSGFLRDQHQRKYELDNFVIKARKAKFYESIPIWIYRIKNKFYDNQKFISESVGTTIINENQNRFIKNLKKKIKLIKKTIWLCGYWQSPLYFNHHSKIIKKDFKLPIPRSAKIKNLGRKMKRENSVAIGIRIYEESNYPLSHSKNGKEKNAYDYQLVINKITKKYKNLQFYIFCTHDAKFIQKLKLPKNTKILIGKNYLKKNLDSLWLLSNCKHHIFNNSSFYWWGAWLSSLNHKKKDQEIYVSDNFINTDSVPSEWKKF